MCGVAWSAPATGSEPDMASVYRAALDTLCSSGPVNESLSARITRLDSAADRALCTAMVNGVTKHRRTLDWELERLAKKFRHNSRRVRNILRLGLFIIRYLDGIPDYAAVSRIVNLVSKSAGRSTRGFVNAVLRNAIRAGRAEWPLVKADTAVYLGVRYSMPDWIIRRWLSNRGFKWTEKACAAFNEPAPVTVRMESGQDGMAALRAAFDEENIENRSCAFSSRALHIRPGRGLENVSAFQKGMCTAQDEANILLCEFAASPCRSLLDLCAAPGGKFTYLARQAEKAVANDIDPARIQLVKDSCLRLGINAEISVLDAARGDFDTADMVLLDVPCTGTGTLRRRSDLRWEKRKKDLDVLTALQKKMLEHAAGLVSGGGILVYSTCSLEPEENIDQVNWFLSEHSDFSKAPGPVPEKDFLVRDCFDTSAHIDLMDGVFACRMVKNA